MIATAFATDDHVPRRLEIALDPKPCWGYDLQLWLGDELWQQLEEAASADAGACQICGSTEDLCLHPVWDYDHGRGVRTLRGVEQICALCYWAKHLGRAWIELDVNALLRVWDHYCLVNQVTHDEFTVDADAAFRQWEERNLIDWRTSLGAFAFLAGGPLACR